MGKTYSHLSPEERATIMIEQSRQTSCRGIARLLGRSVSTVSRELSRNKAELGEAYDATAAARGYRTRRARCIRRRKLVEGGALYRRVRDLLVFRRWSPQQIAARLRTMNPNDPTQNISHETIYAAIYAQPRGSLKQEMIQALRQEKSARGERWSRLFRQKIRAAKWTPAWC